MFKNLQKEKTCRDGFSYYLPNLVHKKESFEWPSFILRFYCVPPCCCLAPLTDRFTPPDKPICVYVFYLIWCDLLMCEGAQVIHVHIFVLLIRDLRMCEWAHAIMYSSYAIDVYLNVLLTWDVQNVSFCVTFNFIEDTKFLIKHFDKICPVVLKLEQNWLQKNHFCTWLFVIVILSSCHRVSKNHFIHASRKIYDE